jgi:hypothetical protein
VCYGGYGACVLPLRRTRKKREELVGGPSWGVWAWSRTAQTGWVELTRFI